MAKQKLPWGKFYWSDWRGDPALRICGLAARGLWIDMLCIAADANPRGYVLVNGISPTTPDLARMIGATENEVEILLSELFKNGVCSRDRKNRIYSRRMVKDEKKAKVSRKNGQLGGNPRLSKQRNNTRWDNHQDNVEVNTQRLEARDQSLESKEVRKKEREVSVSKRPPAKRGTRLTKDWVLPEEWSKWATSQGHPNPSLEAETFRDYWIAASGRNAVKLDWQATWRNWVRRCDPVKQRASHMPPKALSATERREMDELVVSSQNEIEGARNARMGQ